MVKVADLVKLWPRANDLARELKVSPSRISDWKNRNAIPVSYWQTLLESARRRRIRGVTADLLVRMHGSAEAEQPMLEDDAMPRPHDDRHEGPRSGHFSRHKHVRRSHFGTADEIEDHIRALREEWSRR